MFWTRCCQAPFWGRPQSDRWPQPLSTCRPASQAWKAPPIHTGPVRADPGWTGAQHARPGLPATQRMWQLGVHPPTPAATSDQWVESSVQGTQPVHTPRATPSNEGIPRARGAWSRACPADQRLPGLSAALPARGKRRGTVAVCAGLVGASLSTGFSAFRISSSLSIFSAV